MNRNYHASIVLMGIMLVGMGVLIHWVSHWAVRAILLAVAGGMLVWLWHSASFVTQQVERFFLAIKNKDFMIRFPRTSDKELGEMYGNMNEIMGIYSSNLIDIETKRLYYDRILRVMTHELRNSITPVISLADDMLKRPEAYERENMREGLSVISEQCTSIKSFLDAYYDMTHLPKPNVKEIEVRALYGKLDKLYGSTSGIKVDFMAAEGMTVRADVDLLLRVMNNLLKNAMEAVSGKEGAHIIVRATNSMETTDIAVADNGPGIAAENRTQIFLPFYTTKSGGSGVGLCLSRQIVNMHKGELTCTSSELGGAEFIIRLPK